MDKFLQKAGYQKIGTNLPEYGLFFSNAGNTMEMILLVEDRQGLYLTRDQYLQVRQQAIQIFQSRGVQNVHLMTLIVTEDYSKAKLLCEEDQFCWMIDQSKRKLVIYENQVMDFYGIRRPLEDYLQTVTEEDLNRIEEAIESTEEVQRKKQKVDWKRYVSFTNFLVLVNLIVFTICTITGDLLYNIVDLYNEAIFQNHEYYRLLTSLFLHAGVEHIAGNMLVLFMTGMYVERILGIGRFIILYFVSGLGGSFLSMYMQQVSGEYYHSLGASGAIFGLLGALMVFVLLRHKEVRMITGPRLLFYVVYSIYLGFRTTNIDNYAHIGGMMTGIMVSLLLWMTCRDVSKLESAERKQ